MDWTIVIPLLVLLAVAVWRLYVVERELGESIALTDRATATGEQWKARAHEYNALWLEERALTRELLAAPRTPTRAAPDSEPAEDDAVEPMTVGQADMLVVEAERRRREREAAERARRVSEGDGDDEPEAPDLTGLEPVPIADERAMPVNRLTESVGGEDDDES